MATFNSEPARAAKWTLAAAGFLTLTAGILLAGQTEWKTSAAFAKSEFQRAQTRFQSDAENPTNAWQFARAAFDFAEFSTNDTQRADLARQGIAACRALITREPKIAAGHYYLAMNLGQMARTEFFGALRLVREMEREFQAAAALDPRLDYAGPERNLGLLYREAPGWPVSIGSQRKARPFAEQAVQLVPEFPENHLNLIEAYLKWGEPAAAKKQLSTLDAIWPAARTNLTGAKWAQSWDNWSLRRAAARKQLDKKAVSP
jgi:tetratricopeptide (TPR) repeat protein